MSGQTACTFTSSETVAGDQYVAICLLAEWGRRRNWRINVRPDGFPFAVTLVTTPAGVLDMLRCRELLEGEKRRKALLHWVQAHSRHRVSDPDPEAVIEIKKYLRGSRECVWYGLRVTIDVPEGEAV